SGAILRQTTVQSAAIGVSCGSDKLTALSSVALIGATSAVRQSAPRAGDIGAISATTGAASATTRAASATTGAASATTRDMTALSSTGALIRETTRDLTALFSVALIEVKRRIIRTIIKKTRTLIATAAGRNTPARCCNRGRGQSG